MVFEGPLRFILASLELGNLIYLRDLVAISVILMGVYSLVVDRRSIMSPLVIGIYLLLLYGFASILFAETSVFSVLFGMKIFMVVLFGIAVADTLKGRVSTLRKWLYFFGIATVLGLLLNRILGRLPWEGIEYSTAFGTVNTTKEWWSAGERRNSGFARASYDAAMILGLVAALTLPVINKRRIILLGLLYSCAVYLTTSKGMLLAMIILIVWLVAVPTQSRAIIGRLLVVTLLIPMIVLPLASCLYTFDLGLVDRVPQVFSSFAERIVSMWPRSCAILDQPYSMLFGSGLGSIGVPQQYTYQSHAMSSADNLFIYLYVIGGVPMGFSLIYLVIKILKTNNLQVFEQGATTACLLVMLIYGLTTNMVEQVFFSLLAGILIARAWTARESVT